MDTKELEPLNLLHCSPIYDNLLCLDRIEGEVVWCQDNNLSLNVIKTTKMIVDYRKRRAEHAPILIDGAVWEPVESFKFLGVHITIELSWSKHTKTVVEEGATMPIPPR